MEWSGAITGAVAALAGRILFDWLQPRPKRNGTTSGERSVEYTFAEVRRAVKEELTAYATTRPDVIRKIVREELDMVIRNEFDRDPRRR